jgi:hypothetical protein
VELLGHRICIFLVLEDTVKQFYKMDVLIYTPINLAFGYNLLIVMTVWPLSYYFVVLFSVSLI